MNDKWDRRFLALAQFVSQWSMDPSTKTGAVIVDQNRRVVSLGYNGFAKGVTDSPERYQCRETKLRCTIHCETNAVLFAQRDLSGCTLYTWPLSSCSRCAALVIQSGIKRCVAPPLPKHLKNRWADECRLAAEQFSEADVELCIIKPEGDQ